MDGRNALVNNRSGKHAGREIDSMPAFLLFVLVVVLVVCCLLLSADFILFWWLMFKNG